MCLSQKISHNKRWIFFNLWNYLHLCRHLPTLSVTFDTTTSLYLRKEFFPPDNCSLSACTCFKEECVCACVRVKVRERAWYGSGCVCVRECVFHSYLLRQRRRMQMAWSPIISLLSQCPFETNILTQRRHKRHRRSCRHNLWRFSWFSVSLTPYLVSCEIKFNANMSNSWNKFAFSNVKFVFCS